MLEFTGKSLRTNENDNNDQTPEVRANQPRSWDWDWAGTGTGLGLGLGLGLGQDLESTGKSLRRMTNNEGDLDCRPFAPSAIAA